MTAWRHAKIALPFAALTLPVAAQAAGLDGAALSPLWALPFAGLLLSVALLPLLAPRFWHRFDAAVSAGWALAFLLPCALLLGAPLAGATLVHALVAEYLPFTLLLAALYTVAGGIHLRGSWRGTPGANTALLGTGALLASVMGTTGAAMLLIRPLLAANEHRRHRAHIVVCFIFVVANIGGALTPLGDPPLFLGFLQGVRFFWTLEHLLAPMGLCVGVLLAGFYLLDRHLLAREGVAAPAGPPQAFGLDGAANLVLLAAVIGLVLMSGIWRPGVVFDLAGTAVPLPALLRDTGLLGVMALSLALTPAAVHAANRFGWAPMREVAALFAGIFVTIAPVIAMLQAGPGGPFASVVAAVTRPDGQPNALAYFWATGLLSAFLDNAPTYLVFFHTAGGDAARLMGEGAATLAAISAGAVFMGAVSYIGNAPNLMVKAIAESRGVAMPGFFAYVGWSAATLLPLFAVVGWVWFR